MNAYPDNVIDDIFIRGRIQYLCKRVGPLACFRTRKVYLIIHFDTGFAFEQQWKSAVDAVKAMIEMVDACDWNEFFKEVKTDAEAPGPTAQVLERLNRIWLATNGEALTLGTPENWESMALKMRAS